MVPEKEPKGGEPETPLPSLRVVREGNGSSSGSDAPKISLEHILELKKIEYQALMIKRDVDGQYVSAIEAMIEERIQAKVESGAARYSGKGKRKVRIEFSKRFFSGEHRYMAKKAFESITYPERLDEFKQYKEGIYLLYRNMQIVSVAANDMSKYLNEIKERKDLEKRRKAKRKPHPAEEKKSYFSEAEEGRINEHIGKIFSAVEAYNSAIADFASSLPNMEDAGGGMPFNEERIVSANLALEQIRLAPYDESLIQVASSAAKALDESAQSIDGIRSMIGIYLGFSHIKWGSMNFGSYLAKKGFSVTEKKYPTTTRVIGASCEIELPEESNPLP